MPLASQFEFPISAPTSALTAIADCIHGYDILLAPLPTAKRRRKCCYWWTCSSRTQVLPSSPGNTRLHARTHPCKTRTRTHTCAHIHALRAHIHAHGVHVRVSFAAVIPWVVFDCDRVVYVYMRGVECVRARAYRCLSVRVCVCVRAYARP